MLSQQEEKFLEYWKNNRVRERSVRSQLSLGFPIGLLIGIGILINFISGWYTRATMVANSQSTPLVLIFAIILIAVFFSVFYKRHRWEMNEQRYMELNAIKKSEELNVAMQQEDEVNSQEGNNPDEKARQTNE